MMIALRGGLEMAYDDVGVGTPVVFLHGFPHNRTLWAPQLGALLDHPGVVGAVHQMLASAPVAGIIGALEAMIARPDSTPTLATIDVPTLIIVGREDAVVPVSEAELMAAQIARSRLEVIEGAGHVSNLERPAAFNHVTSEFLARLTCA